MVKRSMLQKLLLINLILIPLDGERRRNLIKVVVSYSQPESIDTSAPEDDDLPF